MRSARAGAAPESFHSTDRLDPPDTVAPAGGLVNCMSARARGRAAAQTRSERGDHMLLLGEVTTAQLSRTDCSPLLSSRIGLCGAVGRKIICTDNRRPSECETDGLRTVNWPVTSTAVYDGQIYEQGPIEVH